MSKLSKLIEALQSNMEDGDSASVESNAYELVEIAQKQEARIKELELRGENVVYRMPEGTVIQDQDGNVLDWDIVDGVVEVQAPQSELIAVDSPEDLPMCEDVLCWDGCQFTIDYADMNADTGLHYMAGGTEVESYMPLPPKGE